MSVNTSVDKHVISTWGCMVGVWIQVWTCSHSRGDDVWMHDRGAHGGLHDGALLGLSRETHARGRGRLAEVWGESQGWENVGGDKARGRGH